MKIIIDKKESQYKFSEENLKSVETVLKKLEEYVLKEGKVFTKIKVDGELLGDENRDRILSLGTDEVGEISLDTANPRKLSLEALDELIKYLPKLREGAQSISDLLMAGEYEKGYKLFSKVIEGINWFIKLLKTLPPVTGIDYNSIMYEGESVTSSFEEFEGIMNELLKAFEEKDDLKIANLLKERFSSVLDKWVKISEVLKNSINEPIN